MDTMLYYIWLSLRCGAGSETANFLLSKFSSPKEIFGADKYALYDALPENEGLANALCDKDISVAERALEYCQRANVGILTPESGIYPQRLRAIHAKPIVLYYKGMFPNIDEKVAIACVGTRKCSEKGSRTAYKLGADLADAGAIVVSGMAYGIDAMCARGALSRKGHTIAVLGCGIDIVYPRENEALMKSICENGTVLTEYAPGTPPTGKHFPVRNRLIAGLSLGTVVVEADERSGALITAEHARKQGKDVFAFPGDIESSYHNGTNELIASGAHMVRSAKEILLEYEDIWHGRVNIDDINASNGHIAEEQEAPFAPTPADLVTETKKKRSIFGKKRAVSNRAVEKAKQISENRTEYDEMTELSSVGSVVSADKSKEKNMTSSLEGMEKLVWESLEGTMSGDEIAAAIQAKTGNGIDMNEVMSALTSLEIDGLCKSLPGGLFVK